MILELDCGNSFIKWRVLAANAGQVLGEGVVDSNLALLEGLGELNGLALTFCRLVSVRTAEETGALTSLLKDTFDVPIVSAAPAREMSGVRNGYEEFERLGLDRWLAMLGGFHLASGACLVLDFGTAVTADFIASDGEHLGGFICPGMPLMRNQLRTHTRKIRYGDRGGAGSGKSCSGSCDCRGCRAWLFADVARLRNDSARVGAQLLG